MLHLSKVLVSKIEGQLVSNSAGEPVAGVMVTRTWEWAWNGKQGEDTTTTDAEGRFSFPEITGRSLTASLLPHEPSIRQQLTATLESEKRSLVILSLQKSDYERNSETKGHPMKVQCRTDLEPDATGFYWGTCQLVDRTSD